MRRATEILPGQGPRLMRLVVRLGDPGIDAQWVRSRSIGVGLAVTWLIAATMALGFMAAASVGPVGWVEGWQTRSFGMSNPILAVLPFMLLPFAPALARFLPADSSRPLVLGIQQGFSPGLGPRFEPTVEMRVRHVAAGGVVASAAVVAGLLAMAGGIAWAVRAPSIVGPRTSVTYDDVIHAPKSSAGDVEVSGAVERGPKWLQKTRVRGTINYSEWQVLAPPTVSGPWQLVEKTAAGVDGEGRVHLHARPTLVGRLYPLDGWTAARLREAGFDLAEHPVALERSSGDHGDSIKASMPGALVAMFGFVVVFLSGLFRWRLQMMKPTTARD